MTYAALLSRCAVIVSVMWTLMTGRSLRARVWISTCSVLSLRVCFLQLADAAMVDAALDMDLSGVHSAAVVGGVGAAARRARGGGG